VISVIWIITALYRNAFCHVHFLASASRCCVRKPKHVAHSAIKYCPNATTTDDPVFSMSLFSRSSRPVLKPAQSPTQCMLGTKWSWPLTPCSTKVKNGWSYISIPPYDFMACTTILLHRFLCPRLFSTYSMQQSPSWEANRFAASQEIPRIL